MKKFAKNIIIPFVLTLAFLFTHSCKKKSADARVQSAEDVIISGNNITLVNTPERQLNGFTLIFLNVGNVDCNDVSIITTSAFGFIPIDTTFLPEIVGLLSATNMSSMAQYKCSKDDSNITLSSAPPLNQGFYPWVDKFKINIASTVYNVSVQTVSSEMQLLTRGTPAEMYLNPSFTGCGLRGTVLQRVYNCSKKIINWSVYVDNVSATSNSKVTNADGTSNYYTLFTGLQNSDLFWFVVSCPPGTGGLVPQQNCAWLTPIVPAINPAIDAGAGGSGSTNLFTLENFLSFQKRILLSGKLSNNGVGYSFEDINGIGVSDADDEGQLTGALRYNNTTFTFNPAPGSGTQFGGPPPAVRKGFNTICTAQSGQSLLGGRSLSSNDADTRDVLSVNTGVTIFLQPMIYPVANFLAGGAPTHPGAVPSCPPQEGAFFYCNRFHNKPGPIVDPVNYGVSAVNVPGFSASDFSSDRSQAFIEFLITSNRTSDLVSPIRAFSYQPLTLSTVTLIVERGTFPDPDITKDSDGGLVYFADSDNDTLGSARCMSYVWF